MLRSKKIDIIFFEDLEQALKEHMPDFIKGYEDNLLDELFPVGGNVSKTELIFWAHICMSPQLDAMINCKSLKEIYDSDLRFVDIEDDGDHTTFDIVSVILYHLKQMDEFYYYDIPQIYVVR